MKLLFDANLSRRLVATLSDLFPESTHISVAQMPGETPDIAIWKYARDNGYTIITADVDFIDLALSKGIPPKVIRLERMNYTTTIAANLIRKNAIRIFEFERSPEVILILKNE